MKKVISTLIGFLGVVWMANGQSSLIQTVYCERFDTLPYAVVTGQLGNTPPAVPGNKFNDTNAVFVSATNSFHSRIQPSDTVYFQTNYFSTDTNTFVRLTFFHICNVFVGQQAVVQVDSGNGVWYTLPSTSYLGGSSLYQSNQYYNLAAYPATNPWGDFNPANNPAPGIAPANSQWIKEEFNVSAFAAAKTQVRFRFKLKQVQAVPLIYRGWFVDNVCVEAAPCEIFPPVINANLNPAPIPCFDNNPQGGIPQSFNDKVAMDVTDGSGVEAVWINYSINGGPWQIDTLTKLTTPAYRYQFAFDSLFTGDSICWYVEARDLTACENTSRFPELDTNCFFISPAPPTRCGQVICNQFPNIINTFPWVESFEGANWVPGTGAGNPPSLTHRGTIAFDENWAVTPNPANNGLGWSVRQGATPNTLSGPAVAQNGNKYIYFENSWTNTPPNSQLVTPCIDLTQVTSCSALEFYYHKYGNGMGNLRVDIDTGDGTPASNQSWVNGVAEFPGQTNNSKASPWIKAYVSLEQFAGKIIKIRFVGFKGPNDNGDMAIDNIRVYQPGPNEIELVSIEEPKDGFCSYSASEPVKVRIRNEGCLSLPNLQVQMREAATFPWKTTTIPFTLASGADTIITLAAPAIANLSAFQTYNVEVRVNLANDPDTTDNKLAVTVKHEPSVQTFPFVENFDGPNTVAGNGTSNSGTFTNNDLFISPNPPGVLPGGYSDFTFWVEDRMTNTDNTGPARDRSNFGKYIYTEANLGTFPTSAVLFTRCLDFTGLSNPELNFWVHNYGTNAGPLNVQIKLDGTNTWTTIGTAITAPIQSDSWDEWSLVRRNLSAYANTEIQLRIVVGKNASGNVGDVAIDNVHIYNRIATDVGVKYITAPDNNIATAAGTNAIIELQNYGTAAVSNVPYSLKIVPLCGANQGVPTIVNGTFPGPINALSSAVVTFPSPTGFPRGHFRVVAKTNLVGDNNTFNDSLVKIVIGTANDTIPVFYNFDDCGAQPYSSRGVYGQKAGNTLRFFELGTPTQSSISSAFSAPNAWMTGPSENYRRGKDEVLMMPPLAGFDTVEGVLLRFRHNLKLGSGAGARVEFLQGSTWVPLGNASIPGATSSVNNWYYSPIFGSATVPAFGGNPGWVGSSNGWVQSSYPLAQFSNSTTPVRLRFRMVSQTADSPDNGWAIDNIEVVVPPQRSASPIDIRSVAPLPVPGNNPYRVRIQNTGAKALDSVFVTLTANSTTPIAAEWMRFDPPLLSGQSRWDTLVGAWTNSIAGCHDMQVITSTPNDRDDNFPVDDTLNKIICILDVLNTYPYCNSFDQASDTTWLTKNALVYDDGNTSWRAGTPGKTTINAANSAPWAYIAGFKTGLYKNRDTSALFTPAFAVDTNINYSINFKHWFKTERYHDGGTFEVTMDGGTTWQVVGFAGQDWFNTPYVTILEIIKPGWTGVSNGYIDAEQVIRFSKPGNAIFRFRFMTDQSIIEEGWAVDDFCFDTTSAPFEFTVGVDELPDMPVAVGLPSPNPSRTTVNLPFLLNDGRDVNFTIINAMGQVVYRKGDRYVPGNHEFSFDVSQWANGLYFIVVETGDTPVTRKLVVQH